MSAEHQLEITGNLRQMDIDAGGSTTPELETKYQEELAEVKKWKKHIEENGHRHRNWIHRKVRDTRE